MAPHKMIGAMHNALRSVYHLDGARCAASLAVLNSSPASTPALSGTSGISNALCVMNRSLTVNALCATISASRLIGSNGADEMRLPAGRVIRWASQTIPQAPASPAASHGAQRLA